jgi:large subunit ribosomal protein L15
MTLGLNTIKPNLGAAKKKKRVGRGNSSGHGTYSGRGFKGQKSRSGVSGLKRLGMRQVLLRTPKKRGFRSEYPKDQVVNIEAINREYKDGDRITVATLYKKGLVADPNLSAKILGPGELKLKNLVVSKIKINMSAKIKAMLGQLGGKIE